MTSFTICVYVCVGERVRVYVRSGVRREYVIKLHNLPCVHVHHSSATEVLLFFIEPRSRGRCGRSSVASTESACAPASKVAGGSRLVRRRS